jgi:valyl-tRNA synthetase
LPDERYLGPGERWLRSRAAATVEVVDAAIANYALGEATRLLYDAIWNEFCDWGVELAKVRLADETLTAETHEATWWALVEVLDTYLRLLHPVMPFVTEALWTAIPHRDSDPELLIVARWPAPGRVEPQAEEEVDALIALVTELRNARASARLAAADWLETMVVLPHSLGATFEALRPAIQRLARARPLVRELTPEALHAATHETDLVVVVAGTGIEATIRPAAGDAAAADLERARLERELDEAERRLAAARSRLANDAFVSRAAPEVVAGARALETELVDQVARLRDRLGS